MNSRLLFPLQRTIAATALAWLVSSPAGAVTVSTDFTRDLIVGPTVMMQTPGQALSAAGVRDDIGSQWQILCRTPDPGCTGGPGVAALPLISSLPGLMGKGAAIAGMDSASTALTVFSEGSALGAGHHVLDLLSGDFQRLRFDVGGPNLPDTIEVDITFTLSAEVQDNSSIESGALYFPTAQALVEVLDASTVDPVGPVPSIHAAFSAQAIIDSFGLDEVVDATHTFSAKPNVDYWVRVITGVNLTLPVVGTSDNYAGLDVTLETFADPTFALNAEFADAHPEVAADLEISRLHLTTVPVPPALPLLLGALLVGGWISRARR